MTHFVRFALIGAMAAGASIYALAQDDDLDALLNMLEDETAEEVAADDSSMVDLPTQDDAAPAEEDATGADEAPAPEVELVADEDPVEDEAPAEEEPAADEEPAVEEDVVEEVAEEPAEEEVVEEVTEEPVADEEPAAEEDVVEEVAEEPAEEEAVEEVTEEPVADEEPAAEEDVVEEVAEEPAEEEVVEEVTEEPADEEPVAEVEPVAPATPAAKGGLLGGLEDTTANLQKVTEEERALNDLEMLMRLKNKGIENHALACLNKARDLMKTPPPAGKEIEQYQNAIKMYDDAALYLGKVNRDELIPLRNECSNGVREAQYRQAVTHFRYKEYDQAMAMAQVVQRAGHPYGAKLIEQITTEQNRPAEFHQNPILPEYAKDDYKAKRLVIMERMQRATTYYHLAKYKDANDQLELILREDPSNEEAINLRYRIERRDAQRARELKYSTHAEMIRQVEENWTPIGALGRNAEELYTPTVSKGEIAKVDDDGKKEAAIIMDKLNYIRLPEFSIRPPSTLADAVQIFAEASKAYDKPELPPEEKGISFVLNMGSTTAAAEESSEGGEEEDMFASEDSAASGGLPPIQNINMPWVTLKEALDMVCEVTGSKYVIKGKTVLVVPKTYVDGKMETRSYNVMATIAEKVTAINTELSAGSDDSGGWDVGGGDAGGDMGSSDSGQWKKLFTDLGVPFEGKASIVYLPSVGKLRVTNTPENLALFENILEELNVTPYQIEVEARFVEVSQTDMNSLGFEWQLNSDVVGTVGSGIDWASSAISNNANSGLAAGGTGANGHVFRHSSTGGTGDGNFAIHGGANSLNQGMRFLGDSSTYANRINLASSGLAPDDRFATFSAVFGKMDMTMILHMLAQRTDTDMLSSPKVLARPTHEAMIRVVTEWIYPTEFDITQLDNDDNNNNWGNGNSSTSLIGGGQQVQPPPVKFAVEPQSFEKQEVGVSLTVIPEVSQEGQMINLLVNPKVVEFLENFDYGMEIPYVDYGMTASMVTSATIKYYKVKMPQPKFHFREINTYLSVYNGATVVMGGLITEKRNSFEDKVPFLGDLPFIGFLFRSSGEYSEKRNLLIFLTARLVDPAGRPLKTATDGRTGASAMDAGNTGTMSSTVE